MSLVLILYVQKRIFFPDLLGEIGLKTHQDKRTDSNTPDTQDKKKFLLVCSEQNHSFKASFDHFLKECSKNLSVSPYLFGMPKGGN